MSAPECVVAYVDHDGRLRCGECCKQDGCEEHRAREGCPACGGTGAISGDRLNQLWPESKNRYQLVELVVWPRDLEEGM